MLLIDGENSLGIKLQSSMVSDSLLYRVVFVFMRQRCVAGD